MWRAGCGSIVLKGASAALFAEALQDLLWELENEIGDDGPCGLETGTAAFDRLSTEQKVAALHLVTTGLLDPAASCPPLYAATEGALAAVYRHLISLVDVEIDTPELKPFWRPLVAAALQEMKDVDVPPVDSVDEEEWAIQIDMLMTSLLWDTDFDMLDHFLDLAPDEAAARREAMTIADNYFVWAPPDPSPEECRALLRELAALCERQDPSLPADTPGQPR